MRKLLLFAAIILGYEFCYAQWSWDITFDHGSGLDRIILPEGNNGLWQIGTPSKSIFNEANSSPDAIVTDTSNPYPPGDTASFIVVHFAADGWEVNYPKIDVGGWYYVHSDSLTDYGFIEFSADKGETWTLVDSANSGCCSWGASQEYPVFTGNSNGWKHFYYCLCTTVPVEFGDTVLYRFTFISDANQTFKDGLMFDDLHFEDWGEGIDEKPNNRLISISPNPAARILRISTARSFSKKSLLIYDLTGKIIYENQDFSSEYIDISRFPDGMYVIRFVVQDEYAIQRFVVKH
ncbi:MAG TPA: T9SS type A sorting domain-containing protein [Bacteroidales bacterium]|nr:T9SS type A sorting domain-containing protein [Bacteroidales bacterium]